MCICVIVCECSGFMFVVSTCIYARMQADNVGLIVNIAQQPWPPIVAEDVPSTRAMALLSILLTVAHVTHE